MALRRLVLANLPAVQLAVQLPQAMHLSTSGSMVAREANFVVSALSRSILELGLRVYPNLFIWQDVSFLHCQVIVDCKRGGTGFVQAVGKSLWTCTGSGEEYARFGAFLQVE